MTATGRTMILSPILNVMTAAAEKAARGLVRDFGELEHLQVSKKGLGDFVSTADKRSESILIHELSKARPSYSFLTEETGAIPGEDSEFCWIVDPLDGTLNFLHGIPHFAIVIALKKGDEIVASVTYSPLQDEMYWAEKGKGAFLNQRRLRVSGRRHLDEAVVALGTPFGNHGDIGIFQKRLEKIMPITAGTRRFGAAALDLAYVASGRFDAFFEDHLYPWDMAAGILLVKEAGGYITEVNGGKDMLNSGSVLAANEYLHGDLQKILKVS
jgi:myo-inositol-1(or 4)-monophosphatase